MGRWFKLLACFAVLLASAAAFVVYLLRVNSNPTVLILPIDEYSYPWHPNAWATEDAQNLESVARASQRVRVVKADKRQDTSFEDWLDRYLDSKIERRFVEGGPGGGYIFPRYLAIATYLSAHIALNAAGEPCVLVPQASAERSSTSDPWYGVTARPLKDLLVRLAARMNEEQVNTWWTRSQNRKLVVLDLCKSPIDMRLGEPAADLHARIQKTVESINDPELAVLVSCGPGQRSWTLPEVGGSIFGLRFAQAIAGAADRPGRGSGRITLDEIVDYLSTRVPQDARRYRGAEQKPECYFGTGAELDFELAFSGGASSELPTKAAFATAGGQRIASAWNAFAAWRKAMLPLDPWAVAEAEARLVNCERLLIAGSLHADQLNEELRHAEQLIREPVPQWPVEVPGRSRALANEPAYARLADETKQQITAWLEQPAEPPADAPPPEMPQLPRRDVHVALWHYFSHLPSDQRLDARRLNLAAQLFDRSAAAQQSVQSSQADLPSRDEVLLESLFVGFRAAGGSFDTAVDHSVQSQERQSETAAVVDLDRMASLVPYLVQIHSKLEELNGIADPRLHALIHQHRPLHQAFLEALDRWHLGLATSEGLVGAENLLESLGHGSASDRGEIAAAFIHKRRCERTLQLYDRIRSELPAIAWVGELQADASDRGLQKEIRELAKKAGSLFEELRRLSDSDVAPVDLANVESLQADYESLRGAFYNPANELSVKQRSVDPLTRSRMIGWLESPALVTEDTIRIRNGIRENLLGYYQAAPPDDQQIEPKHTEQIIADRGGKGFAFEIAALLDSTGSQAADQLQPIGGDSSASRGVALRERLIGQQREVVASARSITVDRQRLSEPAALGHLAAIASEGRSIGPWILDASLEGASPTRERWAADSQRALASLAEQTCRDFWELPDSGGADDGRLPYFAQLATNYLDAAKLCRTHENFASAALLDAAYASVDAYVDASRKWRSEIFADLPSEPTREPEVMVNNPVDRVAAWTVLRGALSDGPTIMGGSNPSMKVQIDLSGPPNLPRPLHAFLRGRIADEAVTRQGSIVVPQIQWRVDPVRIAKVRVDGPRVERRIMFVLDCSRSFLPRDPNAPNPTREHDQAKAKLISTIELLPENTEVGLLVFGHSAEWQELRGVIGVRLRNDRELLARYALTGDKAAMRTPENDIDLAIPVQKLTDEVKNRFRQELDLLTPYGYTPLYRAIDVGRQELLQGSREGVEDQIVVITDGADNVYPSRANFNRRKLPPVDLKVLRRALDKASMKLYTIAYNYKDANRQIESLSDDWTDADTESLDEVLKNLLGMKTYTVSWQGQQGRPQTQDFGSVWSSATITSPTMLRVDVDADGRSVRQEMMVRGGEFFDMLFAPEARALYFLPHDIEVVGTLSRIPLESADDAIEMQSLVRPEGSQGNFLRIGLQRDDDAGRKINGRSVQSRPPLRPSRVWIELKMPIEDDPQPRVAYLSDVQWEPESRVPIFRIPFTDGKPEELRVWLRFDKSHVAADDLVRLSQWNTSRFAELMEEPQMTTARSGWTTVEFGLPADKRLRWKLQGIVNAGAEPLLKQISYSVSDPQRQAYTFDGRLDDVEFEVEEMPAADQPNTDGWLTSDWVNVSAN